MSADDKDWPTGPIRISWLGITATWRLGCLGMMLYEGNIIAGWLRFIWRFSVRTFWWWRLGDLTRMMHKLNPNFEAECDAFFERNKAAKTLPSGQSPAALP
jgi:hypothetical protein